MTTAPTLMPTVFVGHGSPLTAFEDDNPYVAGWRALGGRLPRPKAVLVISALMAAINGLAGPRSNLTHGPGPGGAPARFLERLPGRLRGGELYAVESQDHYLKLHTSRGADLILLRLSDAVAELDGLEGAQTHRSWWVARSAIAESRRRDGRAMLTLVNGLEVPVSRAYARSLREEGWF